MLYAIICRDKPDHLAVRVATRDAHLAHIAGAGGAVVQAGPLLDDAGAMAGSLLIYEAEGIEAPRAWAAADPYAAAGLFASVAIHPWKRVIG